MIGSLGRYEYSIFTPSSLPIKRRPLYQLSYGRTKLSKHGKVHSVLVKEYFHRPSLPFQRRPPIRDRLCSVTEKTSRVNVSPAGDSLSKNKPSAASSQTCLPTKLWVDVPKSNTISIFVQSRGDIARNAAQMIANGRVRVKVVPSPSTEVNVIFPPIFSTSMRVKNNPSPVPTTPSVPFVPARKNF